MNILITGGASGLGEAITRQLASGNLHTIHFTYNNSIENARKIENEYSNAKGIMCDFKDPGKLSNLANAIQNMDLDVLINNAMTKMSKNRFHEMNAQDFINGFQYNIMPVIMITQQAIAIFRRKKFGKIINILSSALVNKPPIGWSEYVASKAYLASLSNSWAVENANFNITSNSISPSLMRTGLVSDIDERIIEDIISKSPHKRLLKTEEVAQAVLSLVNAPQQVNGTNLVINSASDII
jgi:3-oxoacyl-[acyl-carrier protein] reductase